MRNFSKMLKRLNTTEGLNVNTFSQGEMKRFLREWLKEAYEDAYFEYSHGSFYSVLYVENGCLFETNYHYISGSDELPEKAVVIHEIYRWASEGDGCPLCERTSERFIKNLCDKCRDEEVSIIINGYNSHLDEMAKQIYEAAKAS